MKKPKKTSLKQKAAAMPKDEPQMKDMAFDRNFTKAGTPRLNASSEGSGKGSMGQRR